MPPGRPSAPSRPPLRGATAQGAGDSGPSGTRAKPCPRWDLPRRHRQRRPQLAPGCCALGSLPGAGRRGARPRTHTPSGLPGTRCPAPAAPRGADASHPPILQKGKLRPLAWSEASVVEPRVGDAEGPRPLAAELGSPQGPRGRAG